MLTAVVQMRGEPTGLALTLSALVPAVAEGLMSHAVVVFERPDSSAERIADAMGATLLTRTRSVWADGAAAARGDWVLLLQAGEEPMQGWISALERHLMVQSSARMTPALLPAVGALPGLRERLSLLASRGRAYPGLVASRRAVAAGETLARPVRLAAGRLPIRD
jgi:hypothetical protein